ncbi:hypothetical protein BY996DRAFT_6532330 [Phakopsora pachyrhizi]|nr:hypothetical protein BY996DRAFT_6532330 [Phakopsora pachyrhizi]
MTVLIDGKLEDPLIKDKKVSLLGRVICGQKISMGSVSEGSSCGPVWIVSKMIDEGELVTPPVNRTTSYVFKGILGRKSIAAVPVSWKTEEAMRVGSPWLGTITSEQAGWSGVNGGLGRGTETAPVEWSKEPEPAQVKLGGYGLREGLVDKWEQENLQAWAESAEDGSDGNIQITTRELMANKGRRRKGETEESGQTAQGKDRSRKLPA